MAERRSTRSNAARLRPLLPLAAIWFVGLLLLSALVVQREVPYDQLLLDPNSINNAPWYTGLVSNLGILGWTTATASAFFGAGVTSYGGRRAAASMLRRGGLLSGVLLLDDLFQLHVIVKPLFGISKSAVYVAYLLIAGWWVATQFRELRRTRIELLTASGFAFALSVVVDQLGAAIPGMTSQSALLVEDASKFLGVLAWAQYFVLTARDIMRSIVNQLHNLALAGGQLDGAAVTDDLTAAYAESNRDDRERYDVRAAATAAGEGQSPLR